MGYRSFSSSNKNKQSLPCTKKRNGNFSRQTLIVILGIIFTQTFILAYLFHENTEDSEEEQASYSEVSKEGLETDNPDSFLNGYRDISKSSPPRFIKLNYANIVNGAIHGIPLSQNNSICGILVDLNTGNVLWGKNWSRKTPIASLTKIMTILLAYRQTMLPNSHIKLSTQITCSQEAVQIPPSKVDLQKGEVFTLEELLTAAAIKSANDAAYQIAEFIGNGDAKNFIQMMNEYAAFLNMENTIYYNANGLPGKVSSLDNSSTAEDMAKLCYVFCQYPYLMQLVSQQKASFRSPSHPRYLTFRNNNHLLPGVRKGYAVRGVNGIKTGYTDRARSCIACTCERDNKRLLLVVTQCPSSNDRDLFAKQMLEWGFKKI